MSKKQYFAFKAEADGRVKELRAEAFITFPSLLDNRSFVDKNVIKISAIWDTGATNSVITQKFIDELGLKPTGIVPTFTAGGIKNCPTYYIDLGLPNRIVIPNLVVTGNDQLTSCDMLIGMDVICRGDFAIANAKGRTHFSFCMPPHDTPICLYEKTLKVNKRAK